MYDLNTLARLNDELDPESTETVVAEQDSDDYPADFEDGLPPIVAATHRAVEGVKSVVPEGLSVFQDGAAWVHAQVATILVERVTDPEAARGILRTLPPFVLVSRLAAETDAEIAHADALRDIVRALVEEDLEKALEDLEV